MTGLYDKFEEIFNIIEKNHINDFGYDKESIINNAIVESLDFISEKYGIIYFYNGFCWDYNEMETKIKRKTRTLNRNNG